MNLIIEKNSFEIEIFNDEKYDLKRDGGLNTLEVHFYSTNSNLLNRYDRVLINGERWRVAKQPTVKVNYTENPQWLYTVVLTESVIILDGIPMPNYTFTQNTSTTKTIDDAIREGLQNQADLKTTETQTYTLKAIPSIDLSDLAPNDKFEDKTLLQILTYYGSLKDARPVLDEDTNEIDFVYLNDDNGVVLVEGNQIDEITTIEISKDIEDYSTDLIEDAENVVTSVNANFPFKNGEVFLLPDDLSENMGTASEGLNAFGNTSMLLTHKINSLNSHLATDLSLAGNFYEFTKGTDIYEQQEWNTLKKESFYSFIPQIFPGFKVSSLYYKYGDNKIYNLESALDESFVGVKGYELTNEINYEPLVNVQLKNSSGKTIDGGYKYTKRLQQQYSTLEYKAERERLKIQNTNNQSYYYNITVTADTLPDIKSKIRVNGNDLLISQMTAQKAGNKYELNIKAPTEFNAKNALTKAVNENRIFTIPNTQTTERKFISEINAKIDINLNSELNSTGKWSNYNWNLLLGLNGSRLLETSNYYYSGTIMTFCEFKHNDDTLIAVGLPDVILSNDNELIIITKMTSNTSCDYQRTIDVASLSSQSTAQSAIVVDENGEFEEFTMKYIIVNSTDVVAEDEETPPNALLYRETFPFVDEFFYTNGQKQAKWSESTAIYWDLNGSVGGTFDVTGGETSTDSSYLPKPTLADLGTAGRVTAVNDDRGYYVVTGDDVDDLKHDFPIWDTYKLNKDSREQIQFENHINISTESDIVVDNSKLFNYEIGRTIKVKHYINGIWTDATDEDITIYSDYARIDFEYGTSGLVDRIGLFNSDDELIMYKDVNENVISGNSAYITINIKEE